MLSYQDSEYDLSDGGNQRSLRIGEGINVGDESFHVSQSRSVRVSTTLPVISLFNMRSIWAKLESTDFEERSVSISILNELWIDEDDVEYEKCNVQQKAFCDYISNWITKVNKNESLDPIYFILSGRAGCGKSYAVKVIKKFLCDNHYQSDFLKIAAPTGVAAFLIKGGTLHNLFKLPIKSTIRKIYHHFKD